MNKELEKYHLTDEWYEKLLKDCENKLDRVTDDDWSEICERYGLQVNPDTLRKSSSFITGGVAVKKYYESKYASACDSEMLAKLQEEKREIRKEKQKLFDERNALNKILREESRAEENLEILERVIKENGKTTLPQPLKTHVNSDNDLIVCLSDLHIGLAAYNNFGSYNSTIAEYRLSQYLNEIVDIKNTHNSENVYVIMLGDEISGNLHLTTRLENRENVIRQVQTASEMISGFVYSLSNHFNRVYVNSVAGNHSRIGLKTDVLRNERLDDLISWYMKAKLEHIENIEFLDSENIDSTIGVFTVRDKKYWMVHGDYDGFNEQGISKLVLLLGYKPEAVFCGHLHTNAYIPFADVKMIRSGSLTGTVDDYTVSKRLCGKPSQMVCVATNRGIKAMYPVELG